jgi:hypothetical protein
MFFLWTRYACGGVSQGHDETSIFSWTDNLTKPTTGPWTRQIASTNPPERWQGAMVYDPLNSQLIVFGGLVNLSIVNTMQTYKYTTNSVASITYANASPPPREASGIWFDYYYSDRHPGEARIGIYGGTVDESTGLTDLWYFYPNGSASQSLAPNSWQQVSQLNGPSQAFAYSFDYDTLRDLVWAFKNSTTISAWNPATSTWTDYPASNGPTTCDNTCNMVYDSANDLLILTADGSTYTVNLQTVVPFSRTPGNYPTDITGAYVARGLPYPAVNTPYVDPMGAKVTRLNTAATNTTAVPTYATVNPLDSSNRYLMLVNGRVLDTLNNNADIGVQWDAEGPSSNNIRTGTAVWMRTEPATMIGLGMDSNGNNTQIRKCNVSTGKMVCTTVADFSSEFATCSTDATMAKTWEMDPDQNDQYKFGTCKRLSDGKNVMIVVNLKTGVHGAPMVIPPTGGGCASQLGFGPNFGWTGYLGQYVYVLWGVPGTGRYCGIEAYDLASAVNPAGSWNSVGQVIPDSSHGDMAVYNGKEYFIAFSATGAWYPLNYGVVACAAPDGWSQPGHAGCHLLITLPSTGGHISAHAYQDPGPPSAIVSQYTLFDYKNGTVDGTTSAPWVAYSDEIFQVYLDSTPAAPHIRRLAHAYSDAAWVDNANNLGVCVIGSYFTQPHATQTLDGSKIFFGSTWGPRCQAETYMIDLKAGVSTSPPSPCDLNGDGVVNFTDVQLAVSQALGTTACRTADLIGTGSCNVVDVQRIIVAASGGSCRTGQ